MLVAGGLVYDHDGDTDRPAAADILIEGNLIAAVGPGLRAHLLDAVAQEPSSGGCYNPPAPHQ